MVNGNLQIKNPAQCIKAELIDKLLQEQPYDLIISELPFLKGIRLADLVVVKGNTIIGFEIKSKQDTTLHLKEQVNDYAKVFNKVYIVIDEKFKKVLKDIPKDIGIIIIQGKKLILKRKAVNKFRLDKQSLISLLWKKDLIALAGNRAEKDLHSLTNFILKKVPLYAITEQIVLSLKTRYYKSYKMFLSDRGGYTSLEDLKTITGLKKPHVL